MDMGLQSTMGNVVIVTNNGCGTIRWIMDGYGTTEYDGERGYSN